MLLYYGIIVGEKFETLIDINKNHLRRPFLERVLH